MRKFITADYIRDYIKSSKETPVVLKIDKDVTITAEAYDLARMLNVTVVFDSARKPFICANFKMNGGVGFLDRYISELTAFLGQNFNNFKEEVDVVIAPPAPLVPIASGLSARTGLFKISGQNSYLKESGAFTGEVSPWLLKECGADYVILGHSERRAIFGETCGIISQKMKAAVDAGLGVIFCLGENLGERKSGKTNDVLKEMLSSLYAIPIEYAKKVILAYEPVWAIGTGLNASNDQISEVVKFIRGDLMEKLGVDFSSKMRILYGGSVNDVNSFEIASIEGVDGALVGGASLNAVSFGKIVRNFRVQKG